MKYLAKLILASSIIGYCSLFWNIYLNSPDLRGNKLIIALGIFLILILTFVTYFALAFLINRFILRNREFDITYWRDMLDKW